VKRLTFKRMCVFNYGMLLLSILAFWLKGMPLINVFVAAQIVAAVFNTLTARTVKQAIWLGVHLLISTVLMYAVGFVIYELCFVEVPFSPKAVGVYEGMILLACGLDILLTLPSLFCSWVYQASQKK